MLYARNGRMQNFVTALTARRLLPLASPPQNPLCTRESKHTASHLLNRRFGLVTPTPTPPALPVLHSSDAATAATLSLSFASRSRMIKPRSSSLPPFAMLDVDPRPLLPLPPTDGEDTPDTLRLSSECK
jgi:hypothetical protein